eukprot:g81312.t1
MWRCFPHVNVITHVECGACRVFTDDHQKTNLPSFVYNFAPFTDDHQKPRIRGFVYELGTCHVCKGAAATLKFGKSSQGWAVPKMTPWLLESVSTASTIFFGKIFVLWERVALSLLWGCLGKCSRKRNSLLLVFSALILTRMARTSSLTSSLQR